MVASYADSARKSIRPASILAWTLAATAFVLAIASVIASFRAADGSELTHLVFAPINALTYAGIGALIGSRQPRNPLGWLMIVEGVLSSATLLTNTFPWLGLPFVVMLYGSPIARWLGLWIWIPTTLLPLTLMFLWFPDGRLPSPRWRPVAWASVVGIAGYALATALNPAPDIGPGDNTNPFGIQGLTTLLNTVTNFVGVLLLISVFGSLAALVVRFRRSRAIERQQLKWITYGGVSSITFLMLINIWLAMHPGNRAAYDISIGMIWVALTTIGVTTGLAILRHRLYEIDLIINRTLVYAALSTGVIAIYILTVGALGAMFQSSGNLLLALIATGVAALLAQPLRERLQRRVNRLMYGERDEPYLVLSRLSEQLKATLAPGAVLPAIAEAIAQALKLPYVALQLSYGNRLEIAAAYGQPTAQSVQLPLVYQAETVGQLLVAPRAPGETFSPAERRLLDNIALQAGIAAHAVRLTADLQRSRERLVTTREEERRRLRRDLHDGLGPQLASLTLTIAATREVLRHDIDAADALLQELAIHTQGAIADIRRVVYELRPPALDDLGLVLALREQAARYSQGRLVISVEVPVYIPDLPAAVEVAAYRIVQEALTNVVRHAHASACCVRLAIDGEFVIEVTDDGRGIPTGTPHGVGLTSMQERVAELGGTFSLDTAPGGTRIVAQLPLHSEPL